MMSGRKAFLYVLVSLIAVAVLVAGGYALYRLGYDHGAEGSGPLTFDRRGMPDFDRRFVPDLWHWRSNFGIPIWGVLSSLSCGLFFAAFVALAIYGGIKLLQPESRDGGQAPKSQPSQTVPPVEEPPSKQ